MPNYCYNNLNVVGNPEHCAKEIVEFCLKYCSPDDDDPNATLDLSKTFKVDFDKVIPMPKFIEEPDFPYWLKDDAMLKQHKKTVESVKNKNIELFGYEGWYEWCNDNWGTKWNSFNANCNFMDARLWIEFDTAWCPAIPVIKKLIIDNPHLSFHLHYEEPSMGFQGELIGSNGKITSNKSWEFVEDDEDNDDEEDQDEGGDANNETNNESLEKEQS